MRLKEAISEEAGTALVEARTECQRLAGMFKEVCWYNFETECRNWRRPWNQSVQQSPIALFGCRIVPYIRNGRTYEVGEFPVWYEGTVGQAPKLPPQILLGELKLAYDHMVAMERHKCAVFEWAPGGAKYINLLKETRVGKPHSSEPVSEDVDQQENDRGGTGHPYGGGYSGQLGTRLRKRESRRARRRAVRL